MGTKAFVIAGSQAALVANDNCDFRYRASSHHLPAGVQVAEPHGEHSKRETGGGEAGRPPPLTMRRGRCILNLTRLLDRIWKIGMGPWQMLSTTSSGEPLS